MLKIMKEMLQDVVRFSFSSTNLAQRSASNEMDFKTEAFTGMNSLQLLLLNNVQINGDFEDFSKNLTWLSWRGFPLKSIPANFFLEYLVVLELRNSSLEHAWKGTRVQYSLSLSHITCTHTNGKYYTHEP